MNNGDTVKFTELQIGDCFRDNVNYKYCKLPLYEMLPAEMHFLGLNLPAPPKFNTFDIQNHARTYVDPDELVVFIRHASRTDKPMADFGMSPEEATLDYQLELRERIPGGDGGLSSRDSGKLFRRAGQASCRL